MAKQWFYKNFAGEKVGPISSQALRALADQGQIEPETVVICEETGKQYKAKFVQGLFAESSTSKSPSNASGDETRSLTPLPNVLTRATGSGAPSPGSSSVVPPSAPPMPLAVPPVPNESVLPMQCGILSPGHLRSDGIPIIRLGQSNLWSDYILVWILLIAVGLAGFGVVLVSITWSIAEQRFAQLDHKPKDADWPELTHRKVPSPETVLVVPVEPVVEARTKESIIADAARSVVRVCGKKSQGTGFLVSPEVVVTNSHVIQSELPDSIVVRFLGADGADPGSFPVKLIYENTDQDLVFLRIKSTGGLPLPIVKTSSFRPSQSVFVIGNPEGKDRSSREDMLRDGVLGSQAEIEGRICYQINTLIHHADSGGPVLDEMGNVIGIVSLCPDSDRTIAYCIPSDGLPALAESVLKNTEGDQPYYEERHRIRVHQNRGIEKFALLELVSQDEAFELCRQGIADFDEVIHLKPDDSIAHAGRGAFRAILNEFDLALRDFNKAIELEPGNRNYLFARNRIHCEWEANNGIGSAAAAYIPFPVPSVQRDALGRIQPKIVFSE